MSFSLAWARSIALGCSLLLTASLAGAEAPAAPAPAASAASDVSDADLVRLVSGLGLLPPPETSETAKAFAEATLIGVKWGMRKRASEGRLTPAQAACMEALPKEALYPAFQVQVNMKLRIDQVAEADRFYRSSTGIKNKRESELRGLMVMGETVTEPLPVLTPQERAELDSFLASEVGQLLGKDRVLFSPDALMFYGIRVEALLEDCKAKTATAP